MIKSAIFEPHTKSMSQLKNISLFIFVISLHITAFSQYTETINSNRPGESQGAFSVGTGVIQLETGLDFGNDSHRLLETDTDIIGVNAALRYGLLVEQLEINANIRYQNNQTTFTTGNVPEQSLSGINNLQLGAKYLIYDPYKYETEEVNLLSYHANHKFKWRTLIPAISAYAGAVFDLSNPIRQNAAAISNITLEDEISPNLALITQNNWGPWVWVNNFIADRVGTDFPSYNWITTMTHTFGPQISGFLEFQSINGDLYSDSIGRIGAAYLIGDDFQLDISGLANFKDTPSRWNIGLGVSYRLDRHTKDEQLNIIDDGKGGKRKKKKGEKGSKEKGKKSKRRNAVDSGEDGGR